MLPENMILYDCCHWQQRSAAGLTVYSGVMFGRLRLAVPDAVLFGDIGQAAFGRLVISLLLYFPRFKVAKPANSKC